MNDEIQKYLIPKQTSWEKPIYEDEVINELIKTAISYDIPPLYSTIEVDGIIIKDYLFISGSISKNEYKGEILDKEFQGKKYLLLATFKKELEEQLKIHRQHCIVQYQDIKKIVSEWIIHKLIKYNDALNSGRVDTTIFYDCMLSINIFISMMMYGDRPDLIKKHVSFDCSTKINSELVTFKQADFIRIIERPLQTIYRVIEQSLPLYYKYIKIHSLLYNIEPSLIIENHKSLKSDDIFNRILNAQEGARAGKIAFVEHIKNVFKLRTDILAFKKANKIHSNLRGSPVYEDENSYYSSKSQVDMKEVYKILNRIK